MNELYNRTRDEWLAGNELIELSKGPLKCPLCPADRRTYAGLNRLRTHKTLVHELSQHCHEMCRESFRTAAELQQHQVDIHRWGQRIHCEAPGCRWVTEEGDLKLHNHIGERHIAR